MAKRKITSLKINEVINTRIEKEAIRIEALFKKAGCSWSTWEIDGTGDMWYNYNEKMCYGYGKTSKTINYISTDETDSMNLIVLNSNLF